ncbi:dynactin subunit 1-like [Rhipicephalus sanguineus]|uniref:dynactin subunit 1-like n=1 Tax=Rhipicephalus sanguineus TaxID=34632 RepID=UPI001893539A|nr:dynactin subunit 1-like [Rhipicephalus sanguineus]
MEAVVRSCSEVAPGADDEGGDDACADEVGVEARAAGRHRGTTSDAVATHSPPPRVQRPGAVRKKTRHKRKQKTPENRDTRLTPDVSEPVTEVIRPRDLERDNAALEPKVDRLKRNTLQQATRITQLERDLGCFTDEHDGLKHAHEVYKSNATTMIDEKNYHISDLQDKVRTLEKQVAKNLDEPEQHFFEVKTSWCDKVNTLEAQVFNLNRRVAADSLECSRMESLFADAQQRLKNQQQQQRAKFEEQLLERDTELANVRRSHEEELQRQRALQDYRLDELRMQAADPRAQLSQAQEDCDREFSRAQALTAELNKKEAECKGNQERIQGLEAGQNTMLAKVSELEKQLCVVSHTLKENETEQKTTKEELAKLEEVRVVAEMKNGRLKAGLEARQQQAVNQFKLAEEGTQLHESVERVTAKAEQLEEATVNASNCIRVSDLACKVAVLEDHSRVEREY